MVCLHLSFLHLFTLLSLRDQGPSPITPPTLHQKQKNPPWFPISFIAKATKSWKTWPLPVSSIILYHSPFILFGLVTLASMLFSHFLSICHRASAHAVLYGIFCLPLFTSLIRILPSGINSGIFPSEKPSWLFQALITSSDPVCTSPRSHLICTFLGEILV